MEIQAYIEKKQTIQDNILSFINIDEDMEENYEDLLNSFDDQEICQNHHELRATLTLLVKISNNHFRSPTFFSKIERILLHLKDEIIQNFNNSEIFRIFHSNKRILLFLIEKDILTIDDSIIDIMERDENDSYFYFDYFFPEIKNFLNDEFKEEIKGRVTELKNDDFEQFNEKRKLGENDEYICQLMRDDNIDEFISYVNQNCINLTSFIESSIFETNPSLLKEKISLFNYSAFFGSIQIFKYLFSNGNALSLKEWPFIIHGQHPEMIQIFFDKYALYNDELDECLTDSFKFHHNDISSFIQNKFSNEFDLNDEKCFSQSLKSYNYAYFPTEFTDEDILYYLCKYDYFALVEILLDTNKFNINGRIIQNFF